MKKAKINERTDMVTYLLLMASAAAQHTDDGERDDMLAEVIKEFNVDSETLEAFFTVLAEMVMSGRHVGVSQRVQVLASMEGGTVNTIRSLIAASPR